MAIDSDEIASYLSVNHKGEIRKIEGVDAPEGASEVDMTYGQEKETLVKSDAGVIIAPSDCEDLNQTVLVTDDPRRDFILAYDEFFRSRPEETTVHPTSTIEDTAEIGQQCIIGANAYIGHNVTIGDRCVIYPGAVLGMDGFGYARDQDGTLHRQAHEGGVSVENDVTIGANSCVDSGLFKPTIIHTGTKIDNLVHIAHACEVGRDCMITAGCCLAGSVTIGDTCYIHPHANVYTGTTVGDGVEIGMNATVSDDVESYSKVVGMPARKVGKSRYADQK